MISNTHDQKRNAYRISVERPDAKRPFGRRRSRWVANIKIGVYERG
jgi:hypothetical protein